MILEDLGCLLIDSLRSRAYLQKMLKNSLAPKCVVFFDKKKKPKGEAPKGLIDRAFKERKYFLYDASLKESSLRPGGEAAARKYATFDPDETILETASKHGIPAIAVSAPDINDPAVMDALKGTGPTYFVFGGGGILKKDILGMGKKFIHIHPGWVPDFRGSHCVEWSVLLSEGCAVTAFIMNELIDGGEIIAKRRFGFPELENGNIPPLFSPHMRSELLVDILKEYALKGRFEVRTQDMSEGETYYKMHPALANLVFYRLSGGQAGPKTTVFLDRDGTVNVNLPFPNVNTPEKLVLLPRAAEGLRVLNDMGLRVIIVTNQAGINNPENDLTLERYNEITERLRLMLREASGSGFDDEFYCPHTRQENCRCRKPETGLFVNARERYPDIDFSRSFVIGDRTDDVIAGNSLGMKTILVLTGHGKASEEELKETGPRPDFVASDLLEAAKYVGRAKGGIERDMDTQGK